MGPVFSPSRRHSTGGGGVSTSGCGCITVPVIIILIFALIFGAIVIASLSSGSDSGSITKSTVRREPLPKGSVVETDYYTDNLGWIDNPTKLTPGMKNFYKQTGVQPHLYLTDTIVGSNDPGQVDVEAFAMGLYEQLFTDEAHLLLIFFEYNPGEYHTWYVTGTQAKSVIDLEAANILLDYVDRYYYYDLSDEEFFSKAFNDAGKRIMKVTTSPWIPVLIIIGIGGILLIVFLWWKKAKDQKNREAEQTERMLNTPLDTFGDSEAEDLANKYQDDPEPKE